MSDNFWKCLRSDDKFLGCQTKCPVHVFRSARPTERFMTAPGWKRPFKLAGNRKTPGDNDQRKHEMSEEELQCSRSKCPTKCKRVSGSMSEETLANKIIFCGQHTQPHNRHQNLCLGTSGDHFPTAETLIGYRVWPKLVCSNHRLKRRGMFKHKSITGHPTRCTRPWHTKNSCARLLYQWPPIRSTDPQRNNTGTTDTVATLERLIFGTQSYSFQFRRDVIKAALWRQTSCFFGITQSQSTLQINSDTTS